MRAGKELSAQTAETLADPEGANLLVTLQTELELALEADRIKDAEVLARNLDTVIAAEQDLRAARVQSAKAHRAAVDALRNATDETG